MAICILIGKRVSSSDGIGVETKIATYREPFEVGTAKHFSIHPDSRRDTRSDGVYSLLATKIAALTMKVKPNCYYQISLSELINNNISFIYAGVAGYGIKSIYGDGVVTFI